MFTAVTGTSRRGFLRAAGGALLGRAAARAGAGRPNIVLILADDLGFGDLECYGSRISTPNINRIAAEGTQFQQFYSGGPLCTPSRAALMTGRYAARCGLSQVLFPESTCGIPATDTTLAGMLKSAGYRTMCAGKWHLGSRPEYLPTARGFDRFFGIPYSHDMWPLPLMSNTDVVEANAKLDTLAQRYTEQAVDFISTAESPFFLYLAHTAPHIPLVSAQRFRKKSRLGRYGDMVQELDWSAGEVLKALATRGLEENTLVVFTSDNGPWYQGNTGVLRGRKGETYEGGVRVPCLARYPGRIPAGVKARGVGSFLDFLPTFARLAGAAAPAGLDGADLWPVLAGEAEEAERGPLLYFDGINLQCARIGRWKLHVSRFNTYAWTPDPSGGRMNLPLPRPELYDLESDPEESSDVAEDNPELVAQIRSRMETMLATFPDNVIAAWRDTMSIPVEATESGALPVRKL